MHDPHPAQLERLMKEGFSVWSRTTSFLSEEHSHSKLPGSSCGATPTTPARRYLRRGRRVTGRGRSETSPTGTDPHSHLRDTNCHHMHTFWHSTECVSVPHCAAASRGACTCGSHAGTRAKTHEMILLQSSPLTSGIKHGFLTQRTATHWIFSPF